ncbi:hypothetical protein A5715_17880 [Mycolicibacter heraklionensis]|nr:hypothetical protein A5715_17880 [Mycolicibacter heraklionensis]
MTDLGNAILGIADAARREFVMCAPFAKVGVVERVLAAVPDGIQIALYTRWRPDEVAAGVSDTEVLPAVQARAGRVYLHDRLHAKYYRNEETALLGSANLTATALGWVPSPNLELLVEASRNAVERLEHQLALESRPATNEIACEVERIAELLPRCAPLPLGIDAKQGAAVEWVPRLRMPSDLFVAYSVGAEKLSSASAAAAAGDLESLDLPPGLMLHQFEVLVAHRLLAQPFFARLDSFLTGPRRFGEVRDMIGRTMACDRNNAEEIWQTAMRWMLEFLPGRYSYTVHRHTEMVGLTAQGGE